MMPISVMEMRLAPAANNSNGTEVTMPEPINKPQLSVLKSKYRLPCWPCQNKYNKATGNMHKVSKAKPGNAANGANLRTKL